MADLPVEGDVVADKYRLERLLGEGGMGRVFRAKHLVLGQDVAIKLLHETADDANARARFMREARATMSLQGAHVVRVFDVGVLPSGVPFMVLEHLQGTDLRALLATRGPLPVAEAVDYLLQICEGLAEAHLNGIVHRDLKPQNLFLTHLPNGTPCVKVLDFGVSKLAAEALDDLTMSHAMIGSPAYGAPEQLRDARNVDARADVWSLGVVLYMLLGGGKPFRGEGLTALCASIMVDEPEPLHARCPDVPEALEKVILACLEKRRERRIPDVATLARALVPFASALGRTSAEHLLATYGGVTPARLAAVAEPLPRRTGEEDVTRTEEDPAPRLEATLTAPEEAEPRAAPEPRAARRRLAVALTVACVLLGGLALVATRASSSTRPIARAAIDAPAGSTPPAPPSLSSGAATAAAPTVSAGAAPPELRPAAAVTSGVERPLAGSARPRPAPPARRTSSPQVDRNGIPILE